MKRVLNTVLLASLCTLTMAQSDVDALRYSSTSLGSTARSLSVGGAFGALGADLSSATINPAGFGMYRSNQFVLSAGMINAKSTGDYRGNSRTDNEFNLNIPNLGLVFTNRHYDGRKPAKKGWLYTNFALGMNRVNDFKGIANYGGTNSQSSMLDYFAQRADGLSVAEIGGTDNEFDFGFNDIEVMAWEAYLIDSVGDRQYAAAIDPNARGISQKQVISTSGGMNDYYLQLAANYNNVLYLGGGVTVTSIRYEERDRFRETDDVDMGAPWEVWELERYLKTTGVGISGRLGMIIKPVQWLRTGIALQTPAIYKLTDEYIDDLFSEMDDGNYYEYQSKEGRFEYKLTTPMRTTLSLAGVLGKQGFISTDIEFVDYSTMRLRPTIDAFETANDLISEKYGSTVNLRIGGEYIKGMYRFRGGYARYGSPFNSTSAGEASNNFITGGVGLQDENWALDLALVHRRSSRQIQPYALNGIPVDVADISDKNNQLVITLRSSF